MTLVRGATFVMMDKEIWKGRKKKSVANFSVQTELSYKKSGLRAECITGEPSRVNAPKIMLEI